MYNSLAVKKSAFFVLEKKRQVMESTCGKNNGTDASAEVIFKDISFGGFTRKVWKMTRKYSTTFTKTDCSTNALGK
jgi:hypothetical protein